MDESTLVLLWLGFMALISMGTAWGISRDTKNRFMAAGPYVGFIAAAVATKITLDKDMMGTCIISLGTWFIASLVTVIVVGVATARRKKRTVIRRPGGLP